MSLLVENVAAFCRDHPLEEKVFVAPDRIVGRQVTDAVARELAPGGWINLRVETVRSLALAVVGEEIAREGRLALSRAQVLAIVEKVCAESLDAKSYFGPIRHSPGFHRALSRTIGDLRASGVAPGDLKGSSLESERKAADLRRLLEAYEAELAKIFVDGPGLLRRALDRLETVPREQPVWVLVADDPEVGGAERELLRRLGAQRLVVVQTDDPERWHRPAKELEFFRALGEENELRAVFRRALAQGIPLDQIEVLYTDRASYLSLAYELTRQYGFPATFVDRIDVAFTRPGRAVLGFLDWLASDFDERHLRSMVAGGVLKLGKLSGSETLFPLEAARVLRSAKIGWGRDRYIGCLDSYAQRIRGRKPDSDGDGAPSGERERKQRQLLADIGAVRSAVARLLEASPVRSSDDRIKLKDLALAGVAFVRECAASESDLDGVALSAIPPVLEDLAFLEGATLPLVEAVRRLREAIAETFVGGFSITYPRPGHLHFAGIENGGYTGRSNTFLVGFDEGKYPGAGLQDPVLLDAERRRMNAAAPPGDLSMRGDAPAERARALRSCLARLRGRVTVSYSSWDLAEGREQFPASALLEIFRQAGPDPAADQKSMQEALGQPEGFLPLAGALDGSEWWLARIREVGVARERAAGLVARCYPGIGQGRRASQAREGSKFTAYDGWIASAGRSLDPRESGEVVSASRLERFADCPFAYFLRDVLEIEPPEELERDQREWLDPSQLGSFLHELYRRFLEEMREAGRKPTRLRDGARLGELAEEKIAEEIKQIPPPSLLALERQRTGILRACATFLRSEETETAGLTPLYFEVPFGRAQAPGGCPGAGPEPAEIAVGGGRSLRFRGSIDRIDRRDDGTYEVWDYKTGSAHAFEPSAGLNAGRRMQHAIYAVVFEELLRRGGEPGTVSRAGYIFAGPRGDGHREEFPVNRSDLRSTLDRLCELLRSGAFPHGAPESECCAFCPYEPVCGGKKRSSEQVLRKLEDGENTLLDPFRAFGRRDGHGR